MLKREVQALLKDIEDDISNLADCAHDYEDECLPCAFSEELDALGRKLRVIRAGVSDNFHTYTIELTHSGSGDDHLTSDSYSVGFSSREEAEQAFAKMPVPSTYSGIALCGWTDRGGEVLKIKEKE